MTAKATVSRPWLAKGLPLLLIALAGFGVYQNVLHAPFVYDDIFSITEDESIRSFFTVLDARPGSNAHGRPLVSLTLALNYAIGGLDAFGYRLFNCVIHVAVAIVLFGVLCGALARRSAALACALIWVVHPLNSDALNMVVTRNEALCTLFYLATIWAAARGFRSQRAGVWFGLAVASAFMAAASKETAISLPIAVLLYDRTFASRSLAASLRQHRSLYIGLLSMAVFLVLLVLRAERGASVGFDMQVPWARYILAQIEIVGRYLHLAVWPDALVVDYGDWSVWRGARTPWFAGLVLASLAAAAVTGFARRTGTDILGWGFFAVLAPTSIIPISNEIAAEHRMYLPLVALVLAAVLLARRLLGNAHRSVPILLLALVCTALGARSLQRNTDYNDPVKLWGKALEAYPANTRAAVFLGDQLFHEQLHAAAYRVYRAGLEVNPRHAMLLARAAHTLRVLGRPDEARALEKRRSVGGSGPPFEALAVANELLAAGDTARAIHRLQEASEHWPKFTHARLRLATVLATTSKAHLRNGREALRLAEDLCANMAPPNPAYLDLLASAQAANGHFDEAIETAQRAHQLALAYVESELAHAVLSKIEHYKAGRPVWSSSY